MNALSMWRPAVAALACLMALCGRAHADGTVPLPFGPAASQARAPWHVTGLPNQTKPYTTFSVVELDGRRALRVEADSSYGNLVYPLRLASLPTTLAWQWRADELIDAEDLRTRGGDDVAVKVCVMFDMPLEKVPFIERQLLRVARGQARGEPVPAATVCYVWDGHLAVGTTLDNAFTRRIRYKVLQSGAALLHRWTSERRNIAADFTELFGAESSEVPPVIGVLVGADADNTHGHSLAHVADIVVEP